MKSGENKLYHDKDRYMRDCLQRTQKAPGTMHHRVHAHDYGNTFRADYLDTNDFSIENIETTGNIDAPNFPNLPTTTITFQSTFTCNPLSFKIRSVLCMLFISTIVLTDTRTTTSTARSLNSIRNSDTDMRRWSRLFSMVLSSHSLVHFLPLILSL